MPNIFSDVARLPKTWRALRRRPCRDRPRDLRFNDRKALTFSPVECYARRCRAVRNAVFRKSLPLILVNFHLLRLCVCFWCSVLISAHEFSLHTVVRRKQTAR